MTAELICVGTELLLGDIVNTNAAYLAREFAKEGMQLDLGAVCKAGIVCILPECSGG